MTKSNVSLFLYLCTIMQCSPVEMETTPSPTAISDSGHDDHDVLDVALIILNTDYTTCQDPSYSNLEAVKEDGRMMKEMLRSYVPMCMENTEDIGATLQADFLNVDYLVESQFQVLEFFTI